MFLNNKRFNTIMETVKSTPNLTLGVIGYIITTSHNFRNRTTGVVACSLTRRTHTWSVVLFMLITFSCCRMRAKSLGERFASTLLDQFVFARDMAKPVSEGTILWRRRTTFMPRWASSKLAKRSDLHAVSQSQQCYLLISH